MNYANRSPWIGSPPTPSATAASNGRRFLFQWIPLQNRSDGFYGQRLDFMGNRLLMGKALAAQRALTHRRSTAKEYQENAVRDTVSNAGLAPKSLRRVRNHAQFPDRGVVSLNEVQFGPERRRPGATVG